MKDRFLQSISLICFSMIVPIYIYGYQSTGVEFHFCSFECKFKVNKMYIHEGKMFWVKADHVPFFAYL